VTTPMPRPPGCQRRSASGCRGVRAAKAASSPLAPGALTGLQSWQASWGAGRGLGGPARRLNPPADVDRRNLAMADRMTTKEITELYGIPARTLRRWHAEGRMTDPIVERGRFLWSLDEIDQLSALRGRGRLPRAPSTARGLECPPERPATPGCPSTPERPATGSTGRCGRSRGASRALVRAGARITRGKTAAAANMNINMNSEAPCVRARPRPRVRIMRARRGPRPRHEDERRVAPSRGARTRAAHNARARRIARMNMKMKMTERDAPRIGSSARDDPARPAL
jgi:hypothetical protein